MNYEAGTERSIVMRFDRLAQMSNRFTLGRKLCFSSMMSEKCLNLVLRTNVALQMS